MDSLTIKEIINVTNGKILCGDELLKCESFSKDTRTIKQGDVYIGIKGENFDGNNFYKDAFDKGATACILEKHFENQIKTEDKTIIIVDNAVAALGKLAKYRLQEYNIPVIAVTGSVGKTSTKDMIYSVLSKKYKVLKTEGNHNNEIGLPLTVLDLKDHNAIILEMGMNGLGEISYLSKIAKPDIAVITNVVPAHIGLLGSLENILKAKLEIIDGLKQNGILIYNNDNDPLHNAKIDVNKISYGILNPSDLMATEIINKGNNSEYKVNINDENYNFKINIGTNSFVLNSLAAIAVGINLNIPIKDIQSGLEEFKLTTGRLEEIDLANNIKLINDAYNANLESMKNALDYLMNSSGNRKIAILGDMFELGSYSEIYHRAVADYVISKNIDFLVTIGDDAKYIFDQAIKKGMNLNKIKYFDNKESAQDFLLEFIKPDDTVIVKASNGMKFVEIIEYLKSNLK